MTKGERENKGTKRQRGKGKNEHRTSNVQHRMKNKKMKDERRTFELRVTNKKTTAGQRDKGTEEGREKGKGIKKKTVVRITVGKSFLSLTGE